VTFVAASQTGGLMARTAGDHAGERPSGVY
jgi:hypothetical protein